MICVKYELTEQAVRTEYRIPSYAEPGVEYHDPWKLPTGCPGCRDRVRVGSFPLKITQSGETVLHSKSGTLYVSLTTTFLYCADCADRFGQLKLFEKRYYRFLNCLFLVALCALGIAFAIGFAVPQMYGQILAGILVGFVGVLLGLLLVAYCAGAFMFKKRKRRVYGWHAKPAYREIYFDNNEIGVSFAVTNGFQICRATGERTTTADVTKALRDVLESHAVSRGHVLLRSRKDWAYLREHTLTRSQLGRALLRVLIWLFGLVKMIAIAHTYRGILFVSPKGLDEKERREVLLLLRKVPNLRRVKWEGRKGNKPIGIYINGANLNMDSLRLVGAAIVCAADADRRK